ncbi:hypothetical protein CAOG_09137 [Capsaspora owczarzaki ATCC 30864]|uniref:glutathione gamma-glutamylcysteinyltransferase n=1 Tax=Capsaspora owczarzaki (strain ATCC 30864) TaxID=595528 RepID=A0A0D2X5H5_CAPO3|nr:hypothetical protein CAOG_09137 [Capsaspora owczarzaki ATCC 30864]KJE97819.1 hypothetical protein CAOG_009137 [Capsaspora owczarzaki ATCC 30864]|eukprot:XP_011270847.1 hypothetical protein CAOG_09137 [Capsaspora owczarzaki ATCC 30864]
MAARRARFAACWALPATLAAATARVVSLGSARAAVHTTVASPAAASAAASAAVVTDAVPATASAADSPRCSSCSHPVPRAAQLERLRKQQQQQQQQPRQPQQQQQQAAPNASSHAHGPKLPLHRFKTAAVPAAAAAAEPKFNSKSTLSSGSGTSGVRPGSSVAPFEFAPSTPQSKTSASPTTTPTTTTTTTPTTFVKDASSSAIIAAVRPVATVEPAPPSFYKRPLPEQLVPFSSAEGRTLFREALAGGYMEGYFPLAEQYTTQSEPSFCGPGTLAMVLNALALDPNRTWKGPWRWYTEELLECCMPLEHMKALGLQFMEFASLGRCHGARVRDFSADSSSLAEFRQHVRAVSRGELYHGENQHLVVSFDRQSLGQTGIGHFSPLAGYHEQSDSALVLDVARFKYPPYWVSIEVLWRSMLVHDPTTNKSRGYFLLSKLPVAVSCPRRIRSWVDHTHRPGSTTTTASTSFPSDASSGQATSGETANNSSSNSPSAPPLPGMTASNKAAKTGSCGFRTPDTANVNVNQQ